MDNYPLGAKDDPNAPYNEPLTEKVTVYVEAIYGTDIELDMMPGYTDEDLRAEALSYICPKNHIACYGADLQLVETSVFEA